MAEPGALLEMEREWPWGLAVLADPGARDPLPELEEGVAAARSTVAAGILHAIDGTARAEVWLGAAPGGLIRIHDGTITSDSGDVALSDAADEQVRRATIGAGEWRLQILVDDRAFPERVVFVLGDPGAADSVRA